MKTRKISERMMNDFLSGTLRPLLDAVKGDDTLCLELRGDSVNIYYRGGSLFRIDENNGQYTMFFDTEYVINGQNSLQENPSIADAVKLIPFYKQAMDQWFHAHPKYEREYQQVILRENNNSGHLAKATDYYIIDIEYADAEAHARFDMVALKWPSTGAARKNLSSPSLTLIEVKYGDGALDGSAGLTKHLADFTAFLKASDKVEEFRKDMEAVFKQKCLLGLIDGLQEKQFEITLSTDMPEVIFLLANHDPDSTKLKTILDTVDSKQYNFPIHFATASGMGYGLFEPQMKSLNEFKNGLK